MGRLLMTFEQFPTLIARQCCELIEGCIGGADPLEKRRELVLQILGPGVDQGRSFPTFPRQVFVKCR